MGADGGKHRQDPVGLAADGGKILGQPLGLAVDGGKRGHQLRNRFFTAKNEKFRKGSAEKSCNFSASLYNI